MNPINHYHLKTLQEIARNQVNRRIENIQNAPPPDYPIELQFEDVRKHLILIDMDFGKFDVQHYEMLHYKYGRNDQFMLRYNGDQLYKNRRGKTVTNCTANPLIVGLTGVMDLAASKNFRIRRID